MSIEEALNLVEDLIYYCDEVDDMNEVIEAIRIIRDKLQGV